MVGLHPLAQLIQELERAVGEILRVIGRHGAEVPIDQAVLGNDVACGTAIDNADLDRRIGRDEA